MRHSAEATPTLESANVTFSAPRRLAMAAEDIGSLLIRVTVALLFLQGVWASGKDESRRKCVTAI